LTTDTVTTFFALLALGAMAVTAMIVVLVVVGSAAPPLAGLREGLAASVAEHANGLSLLAVATATAGSLYFSEGAGFLPCRLCWYQRTLMYPLVPLFTLAMLRRDRQAGVYGIALALPGIGVSIYHVLVERFPNLESGACDPTNPCSLKWVEWFGFVTIPVMAAAAFAFVIVVQAVRLWQDRVARRYSLQTPEME
jgi:disulfide bond formation protein DsbB